MSYSGCAMKANWRGAISAACCVGHSSGHCRACSLAMDSSRQYFEAFKGKRTKRTPFGFAQDGEGEHEATQEVKREARLRASYGIFRTPARPPARVPSSDLRRRSLTRGS